MINYFVQKDLKIIYKDTNKQRLERTIKNVLPTEELEIQETERPLVLSNDGTCYIFADTEEYQQQQAQAEQERINKLTMTALDLINLIKSQGVDDMTIYQYLQENIALNLQLTYCQNVYCGVVRQLLPLTVGGVTITDDLIVNAFKIKNGEQTTQNTIDNRAEEN